MQPEARFAKIEAILQAIAERMAQAERRMDRAELRMEKSDQRIEVTRKLVQVGMKLVVQNNLQLKELQRAQAAFLDSLRKGGGNGHRR
jgi:polynucleotide 5'-kinase involved in rRNA processing